MIMKRILTGALALAAGAAEAGEFQPAQGPSVPNAYIVTLSQDAAASARLAGRAPAAMARGLADRYGAELSRVYGGALAGFAVRVAEDGARRLAADPAVAAVHPVVPMFLRATQSNPPWHLDRIDQRDLPLNSQYTYDVDGSGVHVYVIDTGLRATHQQFTGRVGNGFNAVGDGPSTNDCQGHGTWTSGIVGSTTYGVAKRATIHPVRVFGCEGETTSEIVLAGLDWVVQNGVRPAIVNMSLGGGPDQPTDDAIRSATQAGFTVVVAAGNEGENACGGSPSREPTAITVGSSERDDSVSGFSNFGPCVDVFAPGGDITSTSFAGDTATTSASGTSASSPVAAGVAALYLQQNPGATAAVIQQAIIGAATVGRLSGIGAGSPNRLLHSRFGPTPQPPDNLALGKPATGTAACNDDEGPSKAVNGSVSAGTGDKWCSLAATKFLTVDLGSATAVGRVVVKHAGAGGEDAEWNSRDFRIQTSTNGTTFTTVATVTGNTESVTTHSFAPRTARFVRLRITVPTQSGDPAARIYELEVYAN